MEQSENARLIKGLQKGERCVFEEIYWKYYSAVYRMSVDYLKDQQLAKDALQEVFIKLWENRDELDVQGSLEGFLFTSLRHHLLNMLREKKRRTLKHEAVSKPTYKTAADTVTETLMQQDYNHIYQTGLKKLPEGKQLIFKLKREQYLSNGEIADQLGISIHTVKSQYYRASRFLRDYIETNANQ